MDLNAQLAIEELVKLVREELQTLRAEIKQGFAATMSSLTCSEHVSGFAQDTATPVSRRAPAATTWPPVSRRAPVSHIGDGGLRDIHVELNTMPQQQQQVPPPVLIHALAHQQPVVLTPMSPDYLFDLDAVCLPAALLPPSSTSTIADDFMLFPGCAATPLSTPDIGHSDVIFTAPSTCSTEFPLIAVHATALGNIDKEITNARVLDPSCSLINTSSSSLGDHGGLCLADFGLFRPLHAIVTSFTLGNESVISNYFATDGIEPKCWDPGLAEGSMLIELIEYGSDCHSAKCSWLPIVSLTQRKCGGPWLSLLEMYQLVVPGRALD